MAKNDFVVWPRTWPRYYQDGGNVLCDMLVGPCVCGAWHQPGEYQFVDGVLSRLLSSGERVTCVEQGESEVVDG